MTHPDVDTADTFTHDANSEIADLIKQATKPAKKLTDYTAGHEVDVERLALHGDDTQLEAWRATRLADARLRELVIHWYAHWTRATRRRGGGTGIPTHLTPRGFDLYAWSQPEACDHETVRLGATHRQVAGAPILTRIHVDLIRVAQQDTTFRLLGPTEALNLIGPEGIVQEAHPLRVGVQYAGADNAYRPDEPTWLPPKLEPETPTRHGEQPSPAIARHRAIQEGAAPLGDGGYVYTRP